MTDPAIGRLPDYNLDPPAEPPTVKCDACVDGIVPCDADCEPGCKGGHKCVICAGAAILAARIGSFADDKDDADLDARREMDRGL